MFKKKPLRGMLRDDPVTYILDYDLNLDYDHILLDYPVALRDDPLALTLCGGAPPRQRYPGGVAS